MYPASFEYHRAASIKDALSMLKQFGDEAKLLAGGHSLIPMMKLRLAQPAHLIDIGSIKDLSMIREDGAVIDIGGLATHADVESSTAVKQKLAMLSECAALIGDVQVRNRGTIGGSLAHADPAADYPAAILALEAEIKVESESGARTIKGEDLFVDLMTTSIRSGEILTHVRIAPIPAGAGAAYLKYRQPASGFATVGVAAVVTMKGNNFDKVRLGVTGLAAKAFRAKAVESALSGKGRDAIASAASHAADGIDAMSDIHASAEFRAELARVYTARAIELAASRAKS
ncbi:MAG TPA: xanthine dehydrogenase family protein subunit M [Candidatus Binataceae bacterium]|nr:xanthine dehydrogenase family protein subunit M [Candidatus Binataceae bacterium]